MGDFRQEKSRKLELQEELSMNLKLRKNRGLTLALMILAACMICLLVPTMSVSAKAKSGKYSFNGSP